MLPHRGSRTFIGGKTGTGKTTLSIRLLEAMCNKQSLVIIDPKGNYPWPHDAVLVTNAQELNANNTEPVIIVRPQLGEDNFEFYDQVIQWVYLRGNTILYIDELYLLRNGTRYPPSLLLICTTGRTQGITFIAGAQRPSLIPLVVMSEAEYFFIFRLNMEEDRKRLSKIVDRKMLTAQTGHNFWYKNEDMEESKSNVLDI